MIILIHMRLAYIKANAYLFQTPDSDTSYHMGDAETIKITGEFEATSNLNGCQKILSLSGLKAYFQNRK